MEIKASKRSGMNSKESAECFNNINISIKHEPESEAQHSLHSFPSDELEATVKVEICNSDGDNGNGIGNDLMASMVKSELVEFQDKESCATFIHNNIQRVMFDKIPKTEANFIDSNVDPCYSSNEEDFLYKNTDSGDDSDADADPDPERDPFEDVDCDPSFSQRSQTHSSNHCATRLDELINSADSNNDGANPTSTSTNNLVPASAAQIRKRIKRQRQKLASKLQCGLCLEIQSSESMLKTHMEICTASHKNRNRFCVPCNKLFSNHHTYRAHALRRHGIEEAKTYRYSLKCQFCPRSFAHQESFSAHVTLCHVSNTNTTATLDRNLKLKPFQCPECTSRFETNSILRKHIIMVHTNDRPFKCPEPNCEKAYNFNSHLMTHLQRIHSDERPFMCQDPNCGKAFKSKDQLKNHKICHAVDRPFKCPHVDCNRFFRSKRCVRSHLTFHTGIRRYVPRPFECEECDRTFRFNWQLIVHLKTHAEDKYQGKIVKCPEPNRDKTFEDEQSSQMNVAAIHAEDENSALFE